MTFINGEFTCMTAPKPELWFHVPGDCPSIHVTIGAPNTFSFRAHQLWMRWLRVIYGIKNISTPSDLHWYWYAVISSWCLEDLPCNSQTTFINNPDRNKQNRWLQIMNVVIIKENLTSSSTRLRCATLSAFNINISLDNVEICIHIDSYTHTHTITHSHTHTHTPAKCFAQTLISSWRVFMLNSKSLLYICSCFIHHSCWPRVQDVSLKKW